MVPHRNSITNSSLSSTGALVYSTLHGRESDTSAHTGRYQIYTHTLRLWKCTIHLRRTCDMQSGIGMDAGSG